MMMLSSDSITPFHSLDGLFYLLVTIQIGWFVSVVEKRRECLAVLQEYQLRWESTVPSSRWLRSISCVCTKICVLRDLHQCSSKKSPDASILQTYGKLSTLLVSRFPHHSQEQLTGIEVSISRNFAMLDSLEFPLGPRWQNTLRTMLFLKMYQTRRWDLWRQKMSLKWLLCSTSISQK